MPRSTPVLLALLVAASIPFWTGQVDSVAATSPPPVTFDHKTGNEWWVEVILGGDRAGTVSGVQAMDTNGPWVNLEKKSWGAWGGSFRIEPGHDVRFRALWPDGGSVTSCWFTHPAGVEKGCSSPTTTTSSSSTSTTPPPGGFDATFTGVRGNEWWIQSQVASNGPAISKVELRLAPAGSAFGSWMPMGKHSWGYGSSYHLPEGTVVQMRATAADGQTDLSSCRRWIPPSGQDAAIVSCPGSPVTPFDATFSNVKGNEWWVQVNVAGNKPIEAVSVRIDCAVYWTELPRQSWGGYAASIHVPAGSKVDFQARSTDKDSEASGGYVWPHATPTSGCPQGDWPREGSSVTYELSSGVCGGGECESSKAIMQMLYKSGRWSNTCTGRDTHSLPDGTSTTETWTSDNSGLNPSRLPPNTHVGASHRPDMFHTSYQYNSCSMGWIASPVVVQGQEDHQTRLRDGNGNPVTLRSWYAVSDGADGNNIYHARWDTKVGLVLEIDSSARMSGQGSSYMALLDTNAPLR